MLYSLDEFHKADNIWEIWGVRSHQDFMDKFMVEGKFHPNVPIDVINEYKVVERLLCYSYYSYNLIDEAFSKVTRIFEGAVKYRMKELGIESKNKYESLSDRLKKLENYTSSQLFKEWEKARKVRNIFAHPENGSRFGITIFKSFLQMVNILNTLFLDKKIIEDNETVLNKIKIETESLKNGLFKLEIENKAYLVWSIIPYSAFSNQNILKSFWVLHPVLTYFPQTTEKLKFIRPFCLRLRNVKYSATELEGISLENNKKIKVTKTDKVEHKRLLANHNKIVESSDIMVKSSYMSYLNSEISNEIVKFLYYECWD